MENPNYSENQFHHYHPGGHLRRQRNHPDHGQEHLLAPPNLSNGNLLVGFRFVPTDVELIYYLQNKVGNCPMPSDTHKIIREVELSNFNPQQLTEKHKQWDKDQKEWYFFTPRERKYPGGERPSRSAGDGYWKPTGKETMIEDNGVEVGSKKVLDFFHGKQPRGTKTNWKMHEYVLKDNNNARCHNPTTSQNRMELNKWILCKIYEIKREKKKKKVDEPTAEDDKHENTQNLSQGCGISIRNSDVREQENDKAEKKKQNPKQHFGEPTQNSNQIDSNPSISLDESYVGLDGHDLSFHGLDIMTNCPIVPISQYCQINPQLLGDLPNCEVGERSLMHKIQESFNLHDGLHGLGYPNIQQGTTSFYDRSQQLGYCNNRQGSNLVDDFPQFVPPNNSWYGNNQQGAPFVAPQLFGNSNNQLGGANFDDPLQFGRSNNQQCASFDNNQQFGGSNNLGSANFDDHQPFGGSNNLGGVDPNASQQFGRPNKSPGSSTNEKSATNREF